MKVPIRLPLLIGRVYDGLVAARAGVVEEDIGAAEIRARSSDDLVDACGGSNVASDRHCRYTELPRDARCSLCQPLFLSRREQQVRAFRRECLGYGEPDPDACASQYDNLTAQIQIHFYRLLVGCSSLVKFAVRFGSRQAKSDRMRPGIG